MAVILVADMIAGWMFCGAVGSRRYNGRMFWSVSDQFDAASSSCYGERGGLGGRGGMTS